MSRIDDLITKLCTGGVEFVPLGKLSKESTLRNKGQSISVVRGVSNATGLSSSEEMFKHSRTSTDTSNYKVVMPNMFVYNPSRINIGSIAYSLEQQPVIVSPMYVVFEVDTAKILPEYLMQYLDSNLGKKLIYSRVEQGARFRLPYATMATFKIPVPPLEVQYEIVRVLDSFMELEAELEAELGARKKQYEFYQSAFYSMDENTTTLKELSLDTFWIMPATPKFISDGEVPYITSKNIRGGDISFDKIKHISKESYESISKNRPILKGDILVSMIGTIGEIARVKESDLDFYGQNMYLVRLDESKVDPDYFMHFFDSPRMKNFFASVKNNSGQGYLKANHVESLSIPLPKLEKQIEIAQSLNKFKSLTTSLSEGLPAELNARRKQYEYYRNKLLTFKELAHA